MNRIVTLASLCLFLLVLPGPVLPDNSRGRMWNVSFPTFSDLPGWPVNPKPVFWGEDTFFGPLSVAFEAPTVILAHTFESSCLSVYLGRSDSIGPLGAQGEGRITWSTRGNWLGVSLPLRITERFKLALKGSYFIPAEDNIDVEADGRVTQFISGSASGQTDVVNQWFVAELEAAHRITEGITLLGGLRYDYLSATSADLLKILPLDPRIELPIPPQRIDTVANSIFPYVGIRHTIGWHGDITVSFKGFPTVIIPPPRMSASGYFAELELDYAPAVASSLFGFADATFFARMNLVHAVFREADVAEILHIDPLPPVIHSESEVIGVHWQGIMAGLNLTIHFDLLPELFPFP